MGLALITEGNPFPSWNSHMAILEGVSGNFGLRLLA
jgi:hypothetical protein